MRKTIVACLMAAVAAGSVAGFAEPTDGSVTVRLDGTSQTGYVEFDGASTNDAAPCADGFARVAVDDEGPHLYQAADGSFDDTDPRKAGKQPAREQAADEFAGNVAAGCPPAAPAAP